LILVRAGALRPDPAVLIGARSRLGRVLDLRDPITRRQLDIRLVSELLGPWRGVPAAPPQLLGDAVFSDGFFESILFPSAQHLGHDCVVVFPARLQPGSRIEFTDTTTGLDDRLP
jgi:hypothetical protein